jgi:hypothetical protein
MGVVWRVRHVQSRQLLALKTIRTASEGPTTDQWASALIVFKALTGRNYLGGNALMIRSQH